jgi:kynurenine formamidase
MTPRTRLIVAGTVVVLGGGVLQHAVQSQSRPATVTPADYQRWRTELRNWGRWGPNDQKGTVNLITPAKILSATRLVKAGIAVSMAHPVPQKVEPDVSETAVFRRTTNPLTAANATDVYQVRYHGSVVTHMDTLCHVFFNGQMYNGYSVKDSVTPEEGCKTGDIMAIKDGIVARAVLYDIPQLKGVDWIEPGTPITRADLEAWEKKAGVRVGPGDVLVLYIGRWKRRAALGPPPPGQVPGYFVDTIPLFKERDIAYAAHDFNTDWSPRTDWGAAQGMPGSPIHEALIVWMGAGIVENLDLERVVETARRLKRYEFMMTFAPIPVEGGTGSPVNPLAIF